MLSGQTGTPGLHFAFNVCMCKCVCVCVSKVLFLVRCGLQHYSGSILLGASESRINEQSWDMKRLCPPVTRILQPGWVCASVFPCRRRQTMVSFIHASRLNMLVHAISSVCNLSSMQSCVKQHGLLVQLNVQQLHTQHGIRLNLQASHQGF